MVMRAPVRWWWLAGPVAAVALITRLVPVLRGGGLLGLGNYDDAVYYASSVGLAHGLLPYRDFLLLHPPGITMLLLPFAALGRLIGDPDAMAVARVGFIGLGVVNAVLVSRILLPIGASAALLGGICYAVFFPSVYIEHSTLLETPATTCTLVAVLMLARVVRHPRTLNHGVWVAGALLGVSSGIKIWGVVIALALLVWVAVSLGWRRAVAALLGVTLGATVVCLPFFAAAPRQMWRMVVTDQLGRPPGPTDALTRGSAILGLTPLDPTPVLSGAFVVAAALVVTCCVLASRNRTGRLAVVLFATASALLMSTPSWFFHYAGLTAAPLALVLGSAVGVLQPHVRRGWPRTAAVAVLLAGLALYARPVLATTYGKTFPAAALRPAVVPVPGCITADDPTTLIELDVMRRNLQRGCPFVIDLSGYSYEMQRPTGPTLPRPQNATWQRYVVDYLRSGHATIATRSGLKWGVSPRSSAIVRGWPVLAAAGDVAVRTPEAGSGGPG